MEAAFNKLTQTVIYKIDSGEINEESLSTQKRTSGNDSTNLSLPEYARGGAGQGDDVAAATAVAGEAETMCEDPIWGASNCEGCFQETAAQMQEQKGLVSKSWLQHDESLKLRYDSSWENAGFDGFDVQQCD